MLAALSPSCGMAGLPQGIVTRVHLGTSATDCPNGSFQLSACLNVSMLVNCSCSYGGGGEMGQVVIDSGRWFQKSPISKLCKCARSHCTLVCNLFNRRLGRHLSLTSCSVLIHQNMPRSLTDLRLYYSCSCLGPCNGFELSFQQPLPPARKCWPRLQSQS